MTHAKLVGRGYSAASGTFGQPFKVDRSDEFIHVPLQIQAPGLTEADIVIADLRGPKPDGDRPEIELPAPGVLSIWSRLILGAVDPRPRAMAYARSHIDRIHEHGGALIIVASARDAQPYVSSRIRSAAYGNVQLEYTTDEPWDNWGLSAIVSSFHVEPDYGREIVPTDAGRHLVPDSSAWEGHFTCTLEPPYSAEDRWIPLARNKYGKDIAGMLVPHRDSNEGWSIVLPRLDRIDEVVLHLFETLLPRVAPKLFQLGGNATWPDDTPYQHPEVLNLRRKIAEVQSRAEAEVLELENLVENEGRRQQHLHTLLTGTGDDLVEAVLTTMRQLGFVDVVDVDEAKREAGQDDLKREDIHVRVDGRPTVLGEVKGIEGLPKEANSLQVAKYLIPRMKEWRTTDLRGLSVVNHQRHLPPLQRDNRNVFQGDVLANAEGQDITLLTTWDLFRIARSAAKLAWAFESVCPLFYVNGRADVVPSHYRSIGHIEAVWPQAQACAITLTGELKVGDTVAVETPVEFEEFCVESMRLNDEDIAVGQPGERIGIKSSGTSDLLKKGRRVFAVVSPT